MKPGYKTSEFWSTAYVHTLSGVMVIMGAFFAAGTFGEGGVAYGPVIMAAAPLASAYAAGKFSDSRGAVKGAGVLTNNARRRGAKSEATQPTASKAQVSVGAVLTPDEQLSLVSRAITAEREAQRLRRERNEALAKVSTPTVELQPLADSEGSAAHVPAEPKTRTPKTPKVRT